MEQLAHCPACNSRQFRSCIQTKAMMHSGNEVFNFDKCDSCGLVFLNPRVPEEKLGEYYTNFYLPYRGDAAWGKYAHFVESSQRKIDGKRMQLVQKWHPLQKESKVLDVGCGKPTFLKKIKEKANCHLYGIDFSDEGWSDAAEQYEGIQLIQGDIPSISSLPEMDVITMWHYLEHDYHPQENLRHLLKVAHPGTHLVIEVPNYESYTRKKFGAHWAGYHTPRHTGLYSPENISVLLNNSGWKVEKVYTYGTLDPYTLHWMSRMEQKGIDWSASMEPRFTGFVANMILTSPLFLLHKQWSLAFMTVVATPAG